jgi:hypothetical protein
MTTDPDDPFWDDCPPEHDHQCRCHMGNPPCVHCTDCDDPRCDT